MPPVPRDRRWPERLHVQGLATCMRAILPPPDAQMPAVAMVALVERMAVVVVEAVAAVATKAAVSRVSSCRWAGLPMGGHGGGTGAHLTPTVPHAAMHA